MSNNKPLDIEIVGKFMNSAPVDVRGLASALGLKVVEEPLPSNVSGKIERGFFDDDDFTITVNACHSETRKRFTIAHEIAHYVLHRDKIGDGVTDDEMYRSETLSTVVERQANQYAAEILMPWKIVKSDPSFRAGTASSLAARFKVSAQVAEIRIRELGALT